MLHEASGWRIPISTLNHRQQQQAARLALHLGGCLPDWAVYVE
jgi:hypothetical protein